MDSQISLKGHHTPLEQLSYVAQQIIDELEEEANSAVEIEKAIYRLEEKCYQDLIEERELERQFYQAVDDRAEEKIKVLKDKLVNLAVINTLFEYYAVSDYLITEQGKGKADSALISLYEEREKAKNNGSLPDETARRLKIDSFKDNLVHEQAGYRASLGSIVVLIEDVLEDHSVTEERFDAMNRVIESLPATYEGMLSRENVQVTLRTVATFVGATISAAQKINQKALPESRILMKYRGPSG